MMAFARSCKPIAPPVGAGGFQPTARCSAGHVDSVAKLPRDPPGPSKWPDRFNPCSCYTTEYRSGVSHTGRLVQRHRLHCHPLKCCISCRHFIIRDKLRPCPITSRTCFSFTHL